MTMDRALSDLRHYSPARKNQGSLFRAVVRQSIELLCIGFYLCLIYKMSSIGVAILCMLIFLGLFIRPRIEYILTTLGIVSILYLAMSTTTAFIVGFDQGMYRTIQFVITATAFILISNYIEQLTPVRAEKLYYAFSCMSFFIFAHMIAYHLHNGHLTTWKYLYDTKTTISIAAIIVFLNEDRIKQKFGEFGWWSILSTFAMLCLLSGERKAYILTAILFVLSRASLFQKLAVGVAGAMALVFFAVAAPPDSYVAKQIDSLFSEQREMQVSEFYDNQLVTDQSDLIRDFVNQNAWQLFLENPIMGLGVTGYFTEADEQFSDADRQIGLATNVHGEINRVPVEGGLVGIVIALSYILLLSIAVFRDFWRKGMFHSPSAERFPLYAFVFVFLYLYVEALDTLMLSLIVLFGFHMAKVSYSSSRAAAGRMA